MEAVIGHYIYSRIKKINYKCGEVYIWSTASSSSSENPTRIL